MVLFLGPVAILHVGQTMLVPVTLALLPAFLLGPLVSLLRQLHLGRVPSVLLGVILALGVIAMIGGVIAGPPPRRYAATTEIMMAGGEAFSSATGNPVSQTGVQADGYV